MSAHLSRFATFCTITCSSLLATGVFSSATEISLQRVPALTIEQAPAYPENVARYHAGATLDSVPQNNPGDLTLSSKGNDQNASEAALLCDDPTVGYALSQGQTSLIISLSKIENIDSISMLNRGAKGELTVSTSSEKLPAESSKWHRAAQDQVGGEVVRVKVGPAEAKYLKLTFNVNETGRIAALGVYSTNSVAAFTMPRARVITAQAHSNLSLVSYNLTDIHAKARALYVSSGEKPRQANNMLDDQIGTAYAFDANDANPTVVIDLGKPTALRRIATIYSAQQGNVDFFVAQSLPAGSKTLRLDDSAFADMQMVGSVADGSGRAAVDFSQTVGRYIVVRWSSAAPGTPFSVAEVAAFGDSNQGGWLASNTVAANAGIESDGKEIGEGKDAKDLGDNKEIPAEGPAEGPGPALQPPPPFVFVPSLVPTSP